MSRLTVVKIGGNVVDNPEALRRFVHDFTKLPAPKILVHGGGKEATRLSAALNIPTQMIEGRRVTDAATLEVVTMVYAGLVNKRIVSLLQSEGCNAIGFTGADGKSVVAKRRSPYPIDYGCVGDISPDGVNAGFIMDLCCHGFIPVFCAIMYDGSGGLLNCNADGVATGVATGCSSRADVDLIYCFEKQGVLRDVTDDESVIPLITRDLYPELRNAGVISAGMVPKIDNAFRALDLGVSTVRICHSDNLLSQSGTLIK